MRGCADGINVYADSRNVRLDEAGADSVSKDQLKTILKRNNEEMQKNYVDNTANPNSTLNNLFKFFILGFSCINAKPLRFVSPPLFDAYTQFVYGMFGRNAEEDAELMLQ